MTKEEAELLVHYIHDLEELVCGCCCTDKKKCDSKHRTSCIIAFATIARNLFEQDILYKLNKKLKK